MARRPAIAAACFVFLALTACSKENRLTVTGLAPKIGPYMGGDPVTITGSGFQTPGPQGFTVYFGKKKAKAHIVSDNEIYAEPPAGEVGATVDVEVVFDDARTGKLPRGYTYIDPIGKDAPKW